MNGRMSLGLAVLAVGLLAAAPTTAQTVLSQQLPLTVWEVPQAVGLDGTGAWLATVNSPAAGVGQAPPDYEYWHEFYFTGATESFGQVALVVSGTHRFASLSINDVEEDRFSYVEKAFEWQANRFYFPIVHRLADGVWSASIYDATAGTWTLIGTVVVRPAFAKLAPVVSTGLAWDGRDLDSCAAYPQADMFWMAPIAFVGQSTITSTFEERVVNPGDCPATVTAGPTGFERYQAGAAAAPAAGAGEVKAAEPRNDPAPRHVPRP